MFGHSCSSPHHTVPAAAFKQAPKVVASVADLTMEVFKQADPVYTQKYVGKPFEAVQIKDSYVINGQVINAGDYLMEASTTDGTRWVPMSKEFFEANYVLDKASPASGIVLDALHQILRKIFPTMQGMPICECLAILQRAVTAGNKIAFYNPDTEEFAISSPRGSASFIANDRLKKLGGKINDLMEATSALKEVAAEF